MRSDYAFVGTDTTALVTAMIAAYEKMTGTTVQPASPERLFILWVADIIVQTRVAINYAANQNIPSRAVGENLDTLAELFYTQLRPSAKANLHGALLHIGSAGICYFDSRRNSRDRRGQYADLGNDGRCVYPNRKHHGRRCRAMPDGRNGRERLSGWAA